MTYKQRVLSFIWNFASLVYWLYYKYQYLSRRRNKEGLLRSRNALNRFLPSSSEPLWNTIARITGWGIRSLVSLSCKCAMS